mgnify:CR=1 FL=1
MWRLMEENNYALIILTTQYRMNPAIRNWLSRQYYLNKLEDSDDVTHRPPLMLPVVLAPYSFIDVKMEEQRRNTTFSNEKKLEIF